jgi:hypothetical protein
MEDFTEYTLRRCEQRFMRLMRCLIDAGDNFKDRCKYAKEIEGIMRQDALFREFVENASRINKRGDDAESNTATDEGQRRLVLMVMSSQGFPVGNSPGAAAAVIAAKLEYCSVFGPNACDASAASSKGGGSVKVEEGVSVKVEEGGSVKVEEDGWRKGGWLNGASAASKKGGGSVKVECDA